MRVDRAEAGNHEITLRVAACLLCLSIKVRNPRYLMTKKWLPRSACSSAAGFVGALGLMCSLTACGGEPMSDGVAAEEASGVGATSADIGEVQQPIVGGQTDRQHDAVLAIALRTAQEAALCSGSLIAPNLVLTARHCVSVTDEQPVECGQSTFGNVYQPEQLWVTDSTTLRGSNFYPVREIAIPDDDGALCGADVALLILDGQFTEDSIAPLSPRLDQPVARGESFTAVGFGSALTAGAAGTRRALDGLEILCSPSDCSAPDLLTDTEFVGEQGVCDGDSGGPALDTNERVVGVASRATENCGLAVYSAVAPWRDWILTVGERAFSLGRYTAPAWLSAGEDADLAAAAPGGADAVGAAEPTGAADGPALPSPASTTPTPTTSLAKSDSGCALVSPGQAGDATWAWFAPGALALVGYLRRRRNG
jgi:MYXO-CTERM domain-containing protein